MSKTTREDLLALVVEEREGPVSMWGDSREWPTWLAALAEEFGEVARAINEIAAAASNPHLTESYRREIINAFTVNLQQECIQVAAVSLGMAEQAARSIDRYLANRGRGAHEDEKPTA